LDFHTKDSRQRIHVRLARNKPAMWEPAMWETVGEF
jgi:hypothetical protein